MISINYTFSITFINLLLFAKEADHVSLDFKFIMYIDIVKSLK
jgi:hypothetical protein